MGGISSLPLRSALLRTRCVALANSMLLQPQTNGNALVKAVIPKVEIVVSNTPWVMDSKRSRKRII